MFCIELISKFYSKQLSFIVRKPQNQSKFLLNCYSMMSCYSLFIGFIMIF